MVLPFRMNESVISDLGESPRTKQGATEFSIPVRADDGEQVPGRFEKVAARAGEGKARRK
jgi:hypothetical protein